MSEDDLGTPVPVVRVERVVSLVPSLTESLAATTPGLLVGATDYCTHPAGLDVPRVGGSKYPQLDRVRELRPDLVLANAEENQLADVEALRAGGIAVWVTAPTTLAAAFTSLRRMLAACGIAAAPAWLEEARRAWSSTYDGSPPARTAVVPIWRRPWMVLGAGLLISVSTAIVPLLFGHGVLDVESFELDLPVLDHVKVSSALLFDIGVYLAVIGLAMMVFESFGDDPRPAEPLVTAEVAETAP